MSLKSFHVVFILLSVVVSFGFSFWGVFFHGAGDKTIFALSLLSFVTGVVLSVYLSWFIRKVAGKKS